MDELSRLQKDISSLTNILPLMAERAPDFEGLDDEPRVFDVPDVSDLLCSEDYEINPIDEAEFEVPVAPKNTKGHDIKQRTLDRLAEVLARFKTAKGTKVQERRNTDAKHVTSVIMLEEPGGRSVTFYCSKNEGLDDIDISFLTKLRDLLENISVKGKQKSFPFYYQKCKFLIGPITNKSNRGSRWTNRTR